MEARVLVKYLRNRIDPRGEPVKLTRDLLRRVAKDNMWSVRRVIQTLRAGESVYCNWHRYHWWPTEQ